LLRRFEGISGIYELSTPEPIIYGRLSLFFAARGPGADEPLLIKSFRQTPDAEPSLRSFYREIEAIQRLRHPNILEILDYSPGSGSDSPPFLVLPWCKGGNLRDLNPSGDFIPLTSALPLLRQLASAVDYAHQQGVVHGDIKPENVLLSTDKSHVFLADFGMAKYFDVTDRVRDTGETSGPGQDTGIGGTSAYLSPEQLDANRQSTSSDIYSLGLLAYELVTGGLPFNIRAPLYRQLHARVVGELIDAQDMNPALSRPAADALMAPLATDPRRRPATALEFCEMLGGSRLAPKYVKRPSGSRPARRLPAWEELDAGGKAAVIVAAIAALAGIIKGAVELIPILVGKK
jgi:serine/threonine protein kinase